MVEYIPSSIEAVARIIDADTEDEQANAAGDVMMKLVEKLTEVAVSGLITSDTFLEKLDKLSVKKDFSTWRGHLKEIKIVLGDSKEEE